MLKRTQASRTTSLPCRVIRAPHPRHPSPHLQSHTNGAHRSVGHLRLACWYCRLHKSGDSLWLLRTDRPLRLRIYRARRLKADVANCRATGQPMPRHYFNAVQSIRYGLRCRSRHLCHLDVCHSLGLLSHSWFLDKILQLLTRGDYLLAEPFGVYGHASTVGHHERFETIDSYNASPLTFLLPLELSVLVGSSPIITSRTLSYLAP